MLLVSSCLVFVGCEGLTEPPEEENIVEWEKVFSIQDTSHDQKFQDFMVSNDDNEIFASMIDENEVRCLKFFQSSDGENWNNLHPLHNHSGIYSGSYLSAANYLGCLSTGEFLFSTSFGNYAYNYEVGLFSSVDGQNWEKISNYQFSSICEDYNGKLYGTRERYLSPDHYPSYEYQSSAILSSEDKGNYWSLFDLEEDNIEVDKIVVTDNLDLFVTAHDEFKWDDDLDEDNEKKYLLKFPYGNYRNPDTCFVSSADEYCFDILGVQRNSPFDTDDDRIIFASPNGIIESTDKGETWQENSDPITSSRSGRYGTIKLKFYQDKPIYSKTEEVFYYNSDGNFITAKVEDYIRDFVAFNGHVYVLLDYEIWRAKEPVLSY